MGADDRQGLRWETAFRYTYDSYGSLVRTENLATQEIQEYQYDLSGRLVGLDNSEGQALRISYDSKNRTDTLTSRVGSTSTQTHYRYGDTTAGEKAGLIYGLEVDGTATVSYTYDGLARRNTRTLQLETPFTTSYAYLAGAEAGTTTALVEKLQNGSQILWYTYDALGNITAISEGASRETAALQESYTYDGLGQLIRENSVTQNKTITYSYDNGGNLTEKKEYAYTTGTLGDPQQTFSYTYGDTNWKDKLTAYQNEAITYDAIGNPLNWKGRTLTWQHGRQLKRQEEDGLVVEYEYNDSGIRTSKTVNGQETRFYLNGSTILSQVTGEEQMDFLYDDAGALLGFKYNGACYYYIQNLQGDIIGILDSTGAQIVSYTYGAWGEPVSITGTAASTIGAKNPFRYRGYYYDSESELYYLNSRYYDSKVSRFLNADGYISTGELFLGNNMFGYCQNNPGNMVDEEGTDPTPSWAKRINNGTATEKDYNKALLADVSAWIGLAGIAVRRAINSARVYEGHIMYYKEHSKSGTTNPANRNKHEAGKARKQRDNNGEKGDARRTPNPNKRRSTNAAYEYNCSENSINGTEIVGVSIVVACLLADDVTIIGIVDDLALLPLVPIVWDSASGVIS